MDANNSLKRVHRVWKDHDDQGNVISHIDIGQRENRQLLNDYFLVPEEVDMYEHEVKKRLPKSNVTVRFHCGSGFGRVK